MAVVIEMINQKKKSNNNNPRYGRIFPRSAHLFIFSASAFEAQSLICRAAFGLCAGYGSIIKMKKNIFIYMFISFIFVNPSLSFLYSRSLILKYYFISLLLILFYYEVVKF